MQCFVAGLGNCAWTPPASNVASVTGTKICPERHVRRVRRSRVVTTSQQEQDSSFNYNIYQDMEDRSRRAVSPGERAVTLQKPLGLVLEEGKDGMVFVASIDDEGNASDSGEINEGDVVVAVSATFGEEVWSTRGVGLDRVLKSIRIRAGDFVTLVLETPAELTQRMSYAEASAASRRTDAREKFGEREVLDPVSWRSMSKGAIYEDDVDPKQALIEEELKQKLKDEITAPYRQNWILWVGIGVFILVIAGTIAGIN